MHGGPVADIPEVVARTLGSVQGGRVLEAGCGDGEFTEMLVEQLASYERIHAVDADESAVEEARAYFATAHPDAPVEFSGADATSLPFPDDAFDTVVLSNTIHHLEAPGQVLGELMRVLREEGTLIVHEMVSDVSDPQEQVGRDLHHLKAFPTIPRCRGGISIHFLEAMISTSSSDTNTDPPSRKRRMSTSTTSSRISTTTPTMPPATPSTRISAGRWCGSSSASAPSALRHRRSCSYSTARSATQATGGTNETAPAATHTTCRTAG
jgi:ubiquinone/menaquinone biosynthesis C-methylase UbiE